MASGEPIERTLEECVLRWHANVRACRELLHGEERRENHQSIHEQFYEDNGDDTQQGVC